MSFWLTDPELFLYAKGIDPDDVHLWKCNKPLSSSSSSSSSSLVVPMESDDFDYVSKVENHVQLIGDMFHWDEPDYKRLVKYIYEKHLLLNSQGFVIAEVLHEVDKDENKKIDDAKEEDDVPGIYYIRSLDVLPLKPYIPKLRERPIPLRTVKYLGDVNGKAAMTEEEKNSDVTKLTARVDDLDTNITRLTVGQVVMTDKGNALESKYNIIDTNITKLIAGQVVMTDTIDDLESKNKTLEAENKTLNSNVKTLEGKVIKLTADLVTQMNALTTVQNKLDRVMINIFKEVWMNDFTDSEWVSHEELATDSTPYPECIIIKTPGIFTRNEGSTNVRARYWCQLKLKGSIYKSQVAVCLEDLTPNKEKARFTNDPWRWVIKQQGKTYVVSSIFY